MIALARSIRISAPLEEVFGYVSDFRNVLSFVPYLTAFKPESDRPYGLGSRFAWEANVRGFPLTANFEVTEFDRPFQMAARTLSGPDSTCRWTFEPCSEGTLATLETTIVLPKLPLVKLVGRLFFEREIAASMEASLRSLRDCLTAVPAAR